jgi:hypothetical protein
MEANLQYLQPQIKVSYQLSNAPAEKATLHTACALKVFELETEDGKRRNIQHFHNHYLRRNNIVSHDLGALGHEAKLRYMTIAEGERQTKTLAAVLTSLDPANLRWVGKVNPAIEIIKDMLEKVHQTPSGAARAPLVLSLMDYLIKPETVEFVERYPAFKTCIIDKCNELRLLHFLEYPKVAAKCLEVLGILGGTVTPLSREQLEALAHAPTPTPTPTPAPTPAVVPPVAPVPDTQVLENLRTLIPGNTRLLLAIGSYPPIEGILGPYPRRDYIYSAKHKTMIPIGRFINSYAKANKIPMRDRPRPSASVLKHFYINDQAYEEQESLYSMLLNWRPHLLTCLHIQTPAAFEAELAAKKAEEKAEVEAAEQQEDEWRARNNAEEEVVEGPCDCHHCAKEQYLEDEIQSLQKRLRRLEEFIGLDE